MKTFKIANKNLGESINKVSRMHYNAESYSVVNFVNNRTKFCRALQKDGYEISTRGNYIFATNGNETNVFFFASHRKGVSNYLIPANLKNRVQYFAFFDEDTNNIYMIGYGKVREYTQSLKESYIFGNSTPRLFVPDSWAKEQHINTYHLNK